MHGAKLKILAMYQMSVFDEVIGYFVTIMNHSVEFFFEVFHLEPYFAAKINELIKKLI